MNNLFDVSGRHAFVTGASSGLGTYFAQTLAANGASVTLAARRLGALESVVDEINRQGGTSRAVVMDVTDEDSVRKAFDTAAEAAGPATILVNNAGVVTTQRAQDLSLGRLRFSAQPPTYVGPGLSPGKQPAD